MNITEIERWHRLARPEPTAKDFSVQLGCHFEEIAEMLEALTLYSGDWDPVPGKVSTPMYSLKWLADQLKSGKIAAGIDDAEAFLDALADQVVTVTGVAYCAGAQLPAALQEVNRSNYSKFGEDGKPLRDSNGKIAKGPNYSPPDLSGLY